MYYYLCTGVQGASCYSKGELRQKWPASKFLGDQAKVMEVFNKQYSTTQSMHWTLCNHWNSDVPWREEVFQCFPCPGGTRALMGLLWRCDTAQRQWMGQTQHPSSPDTGCSAAHGSVWVQIEPFSSIYLQFLEIQGLQSPTKIGKNASLQTKYFACRALLLMLLFLQQSTKYVPHKYQQFIDK